ncbi:MAG: hypothetical protein FWC09_07900, partial [Lachnospiraceae bacterium]|nr:hypothetical protein [Lachnospiraceae bacterium]
PVEDLAEDIPPVEDENSFDEVSEEMPILEDIDVLEEMPILDDADVLEEMPILEDVDGLEEMPILEEADVLEEMPILEDVDVLEEMPILEEADVLEEIPILEEADVLEEMPILEDIDVLEEMPPLDEADILEELPPQDEADILAELPILEETETLEEITIEEETGSLDELPLFDEFNFDETEPASDISDDLAFDDAPLMEEDAQSNEEVLSDLDLNAMFEGMEEETALSDDSGMQMEDMDIGDLLTNMSDDEDISDIKDLLEKDENNELIEDDMFSLLDGMGEYSSGGEDDSDVMSLFNDAADQEKDGAKKKRKGKKNKKGKSEDLSDEELAFSPEEFDDQIGLKKKKGFFSRILQSLTESDDESEEIDVAIKSVSAENLDILNELEAEDGKSAGKKDKKDKKAEKPKKEKKPKEPKPKKEKAPKKEKEPEVPEKPTKKISKKNILLVFVFSTTLLTAIIALCMLIPDYLQREEAKSAFQSEDFKAIYGLLYAKNRDYSDDIIFNQAQVILKMDRALESYEIYKSLDKPVEALNSLLKGITRYDELQTENLYGAEQRVASSYRDVLNALSTEYGLSEASAREILALDNERYTRKIYELTLGIDFSGMPLSGEYEEIMTNDFFEDEIDE